MPDRRTVLKWLAAGGGWAVLGVPVVSGCRLDVASSTRLAEQYARFREPLAEARPFARWWWNGNRVTQDEVVRELELMHAAGFGGVEINPIAMHETIADPGGVPLDWLSEAWNAVLKAAVDEAGRRGMVTDLIVGTGWPFGGQFLAPEDTIQGLELSAESVTGPRTLRRSFPPLDGEHHQLRQLVLYPEPVADVTAGLDLLDQVQPDGSVRIRVPRGSHRLCAVTWRSRFRDVMFGAPGADGPVLDHFNRAAVEQYLNRTADTLGPVLGGTLGDGLRAMFCDSIELEGANWTSDLPDVFAERRGYDLAPYLPLVLDSDDAVLAEPLRDTIQRVRYDLSRTLAELFMERFLVPFHEWCRANGVLSRYQAYGYPWLYTDLLDGYLVPDIPEGDQWLFNPGWIQRVPLDQIRYAIWNKYAASGGHLTGRRIISTEAMTNTRGVFEASLAYLKQAADINVVTGINHHVVHGFNYSPPEVGYPGWIRFGTYFSEHNPWWPYVRHWTDYVARLSQAFQDAAPRAQIALLGPTPDVWAEHGLERNPFNTTPWYLHELWQALNHHGYLADYVNATILQGATFEDGQLVYGPMRYRALLVANVTALEPSTARAVQDFAAAGGTVLFVGALPERAPGLQNAAARDGATRAAVQATLALATAAQVAEPPRDGLVGWAGRTMQRLGVTPAVTISNPDPKLYLTHQGQGQRDLFFFANLDRARPIAFEARFPTGRKVPWRWDPETGARSVWPYGDSRNALALDLEPLESLLLAFEPGDEPPPEPPPVASGSPQPVAGPWDVTFQPVAGEPFERTLPALVDLGQAGDPALRAFGGTAVYRTTFEVTGALPTTLDLGAVHELADVTLNGRPLGVRWWGRKTFDLEDAVQAGTNELVVTVPTLLYNDARTRTDNPLVAYFLDRRSRPDEPLPAGLVGPVRLM